MNSKDSPMRGEVNTLKIRVSLDRGEDSQKKRNLIALSWLKGQPYDKNNVRDIIHYNTY